MEKEEEIKGHICPYCGHIEGQINNYFIHIELFHLNIKDEEN